MSKFEKKHLKARDILLEPSDYYQESERYFNNAKEHLKKPAIEYNRYQDAKPVREACGIGYLGVLLALDGYFLEQGILKDKLPDSTEGYEILLKKCLVHNGKLRQSFYTVYENLHLLGYYRGGVDVEMIKSGFSKAKIIIDTLSKGAVNV
ncbi:MAG: DUF5618 family protein [bacterium]